MRLAGETPPWRHAPTLRGRHAECDVLDRMAGAVAAGESRSLVVHGESGVGKTALLEYLAGHAPGCRVRWTVGVQSEMELPFAGLHQLCGPMLDRSQDLPTRQRDALRTALGMSTGPAPDRLLLGLAVLCLLSLAAEAQPLICLLDDYQWLDTASAQVLAFAARRLGTESVGLVFATRNPGGELTGLPELSVSALRDADARALLDAALTGPIDSGVRDQIVAEARGNPLALLELPRELAPAELAGGFGLPGAIPLADGIEQNFERRISALTAQTRLLLQLAAADPLGDPALVWRAAGSLGIDTKAVVPAIDANLVELGTRLLFRHPLARSAAYRSASTQARHDIHRALAVATDARADPDRRAWHLAQATAGPDEDVAAELELSAARAQARGGLSAAAAFLERAAALTLDPAGRAARALAAAEAKIQAGTSGGVLDLLATAESGPLTDLGRARADLARANLAFVTRRGPEAPPLLVRAARRLEGIDPALSRDTYLGALNAAIFTGRLASPGAGVHEIACAAATAPPAPGAPRALDLLLDGLTADDKDGFGAGAPLLRRSLRSFGERMSVEEELRWLSPACTAGAMRLWDEKIWDALSARHVQLAREQGALSELPLALASRAYFHLLTGDLDAAAAVTQEVEAIREETKIWLAPALWLAALRGEESGARALIDAIMTEAGRRGEGLAITFTEYATATLGNGLGQYDKAAAAALSACTHEENLGSLIPTVPELIEAAARTGMTEAANLGGKLLEEITGACDTDWGLGIRARSRALLSEGASAEELYRESITRLGRTRLRTDLARARLLYGEWLRRERRRGEAREQLRTAHGMFEEMGMAGFAERARRELRSTGETTRKRVPAARHDELTPQEALIARLARDGLSNPEIAIRLFISAHTVQYHLKKIFAKLAITSRSQLDRVLPPDTSTR